MKRKTLSPLQVDALRNLKVVRAENEDFQVILSSYLGLIIEVENLQNIINDYDYENEDLRKRYYETKEELHSAQKQFAELEDQNRKLVRVIRNFVRGLDQEGIITQAEEGGFDVGI